MENACFMTSILVKRKGFLKPCSMSKTFYSSMNELALCLHDVHANLIHSCRMFVEDLLRKLLFACLTLDAHLLRGCHSEQTGLALLRDCPLDLVDSVDCPPLQRGSDLALPLYPVLELCSSRFHLVATYKKPKISDSQRRKVSPAP